jgi:hypothetical protein
MEKLELKTYGDLKKLLNSISLKQKKQKVLSKGGEIAIDQILGLIPGASNAKITFDLVKAAMSKPDDKKTNTWLDKLDIDDETSAIVDDTVENGFIKTLAKSLDKKSDNDPLEDDFNMNQELVDYLKEKYKGRTVTGIQKELKIRELNQSKPSKPERIQGSFNTQNIKALGMDPSKFNMVMGYLKQGKGVKDLNLPAKELLDDFLLKLLKTDDDKLLMRVFADIKKLKTK